MLNLLLVVAPLLTSAPAPLPIEQAVATVLARSPALMAAAAQADSARTAAGLAGRWPNPAVEVRGENWTTGGWQWTPGSDPLAGPPLDFFTVVTQSIELGGKRGARLRVAGAEREVAAGTLQQVRRALTIETVRLYLQAVRARGVLDALAANREGMDVLVQTMTRRAQEGYAAAADLAKFQAEAARLDTQIVRARLERNRSLALLGTLLGEPGPLDPDRLVEPTPSPVPDGEAGALAQAAVDASPDVVAARARAARAAEMLTLERARRLPDPEVAGGYKRTSGANTAVLGVRIAVPVFDANGRAVALAAGDARAAEFDRQQVTARVLADTVVLIDAARALAARAARVEEELLQPADIARTAARSAFREGAADILNLVDAERVYLEAQREALELRLDAVASAVEARLALGQEISR